MTFLQEARNPSLLRATWVEIALHLNDCLLQGAVTVDVENDLTVLKEIIKAPSWQVRIFCSSCLGPLVRSTCLSRVEPLLQQQGHASSKRLSKTIEFAQTIGEHCQYTWPCICLGFMRPRRVGSKARSANSHSYQVVSVVKSSRMVRPLPSSRSINQVVKISSVINEYQCAYLTAMNGQFCFSRVS